MTRVHDRGGWPGAGLIERSEHELSWWEKRTDALMRLMWTPERRFIRVDEMRRAIESMEPGGQVGDPVQLAGDPTGVVEHQARALAEVVEGARDAALRLERRHRPEERAA